MIPKIEMSPPPVGQSYPDEEFEIDKLSKENFNNISNFKRFSAYFEPVINGLDNKTYQDHFKNNGFNGVDVEIKGKYAFARLLTQSELDNFINKFNGSIFMDQEMKVRFPNEKKRENPVKTLHIKGVQEADLTEKKLYELVSPYGFIRRISWKNGFAFIEFDTVDDAIEVYKHLKSEQCSHIPIKVEYARQEHRLGEIRLSIPLSDILPENHPFWYKLQDLIYDK